MMDRLAVSRTLRNCVIVTTKVDTNPVNDRTLLSLVSQASAFIRPGSVGSHVRHRAGGIASSGPSEERTSHQAAPSSIALDVFVCTHLGSPDGCQRKVLIEAASLQMTLACVKLI